MQDDFGGRLAAKGGGRLVVAVERLPAKLPKEGDGWSLDEVVFGEMPAVIVSFAPRAGSGSCAHATRLP